MRLLQERVVGVQLLQGGLSLMRRQGCWWWSGCWWWQRMRWGWYDVGGV